MVYTMRIIVLQKEAKINRLERSIIFKECNPRTHDRKHSRGENILRLSLSIWVGVNPGGVAVCGIATGETWVGGLPVIKSHKTIPTKQTSIAIRLTQVFPKCVYKDNWIPRVSATWVRSAQGLVLRYSSKVSCK